MIAWIASFLPVASAYSWRANGMRISFASLILEQRDQLAPPHSITSSARVSSAGGIVTPITACWEYAERYRLDDSCHFRWTPLAAVHRYSQGNIRKRFPSEHIADSSLFCRARNHGGDHPDSGCCWITAQKPIHEAAQYLDKLISVRFTLKSRHCGARLACPLCAKSGHGGYFDSRLTCWARRRTAV